MDHDTLTAISSQNLESQTKHGLTGLFFPQGFMARARQFIPQAEPGGWCMAAIDILHFRLFNQFHGRDAGNRLLRYIADCLEAIRAQYGGVTGYFEGDNFCIIMPCSDGLAAKLREDILTGITQMGGAVAWSLFSASALLTIPPFRRRSSATGRPWPCPMPLPGTTPSATPPPWTAAWWRKCGFWRRSTAP